MTKNLACDLKTGGWGPKKSSDSCRTQDAQAIEAKDQRKPGVFTSEEKQQRQDAIARKYSEVSVSAEGKFKYQTGKAGARSLGYDDELLEQIPEDVLNAFCGVGNPFSLGEISPGSNVLDIGCGAGFDLMVARRRTGAEGRVCGVDLSSEMIERTRANLARVGCDGIEIYHVQSEQLPFADGTFDVVISNGVINLSPAKAELFAEIHRVLKPGGRLQIADMMLDKELPAHLAGSLEAWSQWIGGVVSVGDQIELMNNAGFIDVEYRGKTSAKTSEYTVGGHFTAVRQ